MIILFLIFSCACIFSIKVKAQAGMEYHFVYIDNSKTKHLISMQKRLDSLFNKAKDGNYIFYLSNLNEPVIAKDPERFEYLQASISGIFPPMPNIAADVEVINRLFNENDFVRINNNNLMPLYKKVTWHFFVDAGLYKNMALEKYLVSYLVHTNGLNKSHFKQWMNIILYFDSKSLSGNLNNKEETFDVIKY